MRLAISAVVHTILGSSSRVTNHHELHCPLRSRRLGLLEIVIRPPSKCLQVKQYSLLSSACIRLPQSNGDQQIVQMPAPDSPVTTIDELLALPEDGLRHELLEGEHVVTPAPAPRHQLVLQEIHLVFGTALKDRDDLRVFLSPADVVVGPRSLVQPDLFVIPKEPGRPLDAWADVGIPLLAVEVLSPSTAARDRGTKRRIYQRAGVGEYWIVDLDARMIERWTPLDERPEILEERIEWTAPEGTRFPMDIPSIFRDLQT